MTDPNEPTRDPSSLEGAVPRLVTPEDRNAAMDMAFDYRGDVTIHTSDGRCIEGFIFDRRSNGPEPYVRVMPKDSNDRVRILYKDIARLVFTGRDTAAGKSWETWLKKFHEKRAKGEKASIEAEPLE